MKYQIIKEVDGNNNVKYQVRFLEKRWSGHTWSYIKRRVYDGNFWVDQDYKTLEDAQFAVNERIRVRTIIDEGVINDRDEV